MFEHSEDILDERLDAAEEQVTALGGVTLGDADAPLPDLLQRATQLETGYMTFAPSVNAEIVPVEFQLLDENGNPWGGSYPGLAFFQDGGSQTGWWYIRRDPLTYFEEVDGPVRDVGNLPDTPDPIVPITELMAYATRWRGGSTQLTPESPIVSSVVQGDVGRGEEPLFLYTDPNSNTECMVPFREIIAIQIGSTL